VYVAAGQRNGTSYRSTLPTTAARSLSTPHRWRRGRRKQRVTSRIERAVETRGGGGRKIEGSRAGGSRATGSMGAPTARAGQAAGPGFKRETASRYRGRTYTLTWRRRAGPNRYTDRRKACANAGRTRRPSEGTDQTDSRSGGRRGPCRCPPDSGLRGGGGRDSGRVREGRGGWGVCFACDQVSRGG